MSGTVSMTVREWHELPDELGEHLRKRIDDYGLVVTEDGNPRHSMGGLLAEFVREYLTNMAQRDED